MNGPNIPGWTRLEACPRTAGCTAKVLWQDSDMNLFRLDSRSGDFIPHDKCLVRGSEKPEVVYLGQWFNKRTGRTRWLGPERLERSVRKMPADRKTKPADWELKEVLISKLDWQSL